MARKYLVSNPPSCSGPSLALPLAVPSVVALPGLLFTPHGGLSPCLLLTVREASSRKPFLFGLTFLPLVTPLCLLGSEPRRTGPPGGPLASQATPGCRQRHRRCVNSPTRRERRSLLPREPVPSTLWQQQLCQSPGQCWLLSRGESRAQGQGRRPPGLVGAQTLPVLLPRLRPQPGQPARPAARLPAGTF